MATAIADVGSPLDDYFKDNGDSSDSSRSSWKDAMSGGDASPSDDSSGDITLVHSQSPLSKNKGWTGPQDCIAGPSRSASVPITPRPKNGQTLTLHQSPPGTYISPRQTKLQEAEEFAERFKYLICSSGLLEKEWVPGLGRQGDGIDHAESLEREALLGDASPEQEHLRLVNWLHFIALRIGPRRDLQAAVAVLILAMAWTLGSLLGLLGLCLLTVACLILILVMRSRKTPVMRIPTAPQPPPPTEPHSALISSLSTLRASSRSLDITLDDALRLLPPSAPISHQRALRTSLHRLCNSMTDHLASATSSLLEVVDKRELAALAVMYDIPMAGGLHGRKLSESSEEGEQSDSELPKPRAPGSIPSPRRPSVPVSLPDPPPTHLRALSMSTTHSLPGRFRPNHSKHLSLTPSKSYRPLVLPRTAIDDRFTQLPNRTPRLSARASWDQEAFEAARNEGIRPDWTEGHPRPRSRSRPRHERRITEDDEEEGDISGSSEEAPTNLVTPIMPSTSSPPRLSESKPIFSSPPVERYLPQRRSPLSGDPLPPRPASFNGEDIFGPSPSLDSIVGILPSTSLPVFRPSSTVVNIVKPKASENPKRRSLQSMTYYPSNSSVENDLSLTRTNSLPPSDLQALRVASASVSRRPSLASSTSARSPAINSSVSEPNKLSPSPARVAESISANATVRRIVSLSPLTLPALKAACLGVHLKRRKMACCLLGLDFAGGEKDEEEYWQEVHQLLGDLTTAIDEERGRLLEVIRTSGGRRWVSTSSVESNADDSSRATQAPWLASSLGLGQADFAPRDSEFAKLHQHALGLQKELGVVWDKVERAEQTIRESDDGEEAESVRKSWMDVRESLGVLIREWDRGREIVTRLNPQSTNPEESPPEQMKPVAASPDMPAFMQSWADNISDSDTPIEDSQDGFEMTETLPPPGIDQVFEAAPESSRPDHLKGLSRDDRIRLTKEARVRGMTVAEMMSGSLDTSEAQDEKERLKAGGMVVKELEGMIGLIRRKKGHAEDFSTPVAAPPAPEAPLPMTIRRVSRERSTPSPPDASVELEDGVRTKRNDKFQEDLQKAFVFPKRDSAISGEI